jgi:hypothetical protein
VSSKKCKRVKNKLKIRRNNNMEGHEQYIQGFTKDEYNDGLAVMQEELDDATKELWEIMRFEACSVENAMKIYLYSREI